MLLRLLLFLMFPMLPLGTHSFMIDVVIALSYNCPYCIAAILFDLKGFQPVLQRLIASIRDWWRWLWIRVNSLQLYAHCAVYPLVAQCYTIFYVLIESPLVNHLIGLVVRGWAAVICCSTLVIFSLLMNVNVFISVFLSLYWYCFDSPHLQIIITYFLH